MSNESWTIDEDFSTDPTARGWAKDGTALDWDNTKEAIGGEFETAGNPAYYKSITAKTLNDIIEGIFTLQIEKEANNGSGLIGFFNSAGIATDHMMIIFDGKIAYARLCYNDGSSSLSALGIALDLATQYQAILHYDKFTQTLYLEVYDMTNNPIGNVAVQALAGKSLTVDRLGIVGTLSYAVGKELEMWIERVQAFPSTLDYTDLYCSSFEVQDLVAMLDQTADITERQTRAIIQRLSMPKIDAWMSALGYAVPFDTGDNTPPIIRSLAIRLSTYYALFKLYTGHAPNEVGTLSSLKNEIMDDLKRIADCDCGDMEILDVDGNVIEPVTVKGGIMSTTDGEEDIFTLDDPPDVYGNTNAEDGWEW